MQYSSCYPCHCSFLPIMVSSFQNSTTDRKLVLHEARTALRAGDLTVAGSQRYAAWDSDLYQSEVWATRRDAWYHEQELPRDAHTFLTAMLDQLHGQTLRV